MEFVIVIVCLTAQIATVMAFRIGRTAALDPRVRAHVSGRPSRCEAAPVSVPVGVRNGAAQMSSYVESVLADGEKIVYRAAISHWKYSFYYFAGALLLVGGLIGFTAAPGGGSVAQIAAVVAIVIGLLIVLVAVIARLTTELVLTDRRIITKRGFISRDTVEMNLAKVESVRVDQGLLGRILNYGDVTVVGTGSSLEPLHGIADPLALRKQLGAITQEGSPKAQRAAPSV